MVRSLRRHTMFLALHSVCHTRLAPLRCAVFTTLACSVALSHALPVFVRTDVPALRSVSHTRCNRVDMCPAALRSVFYTRLLSCTELRIVSCVRGLMSWHCAVFPTLACSLVHGLGSLHCAGFPTLAYSESLVFAIPCASVSCTARCLSDFCTFVRIFLTFAVSRAGICHTLR